MAVDRFPVEEGSIVLFRRAIGDPNPDGNVPPPTYVQASAQFEPDYPLRPTPGVKWFGSGREPSGVEASTADGVGLHAEQHFEYHQPMRPGMVLTVTQRAGETWEKQSKRGGTLRFSESITEFRDAETNELVVTARGVGVRTERPVEKEA